MKELIKIKTSEQGQKLVSARELYLGLGLNKSAWKRWSDSNIKNNDFFKENIDWNQLKIMLNGNETQDFMITIDFVTYIINSTKTVSSKTKIKLLKQLNCGNKLDVIGKKEVEFLDVLETQLKILGITKLERQYSKFLCGIYRIDLYLPQLNVAIEYDENNHKHYTFEQQELRQQLIEQELGCKFIRVNDDKSHIENSAIVIRELLNFDLHHSKIKERK